MFDTRLAPAPTVAAPGEWIFRSRWPELMFRDGRVSIHFHDHYFRTTNPTEINFLQRVVEVEARANRGVEIWMQPTAVVTIAANPTPAIEKPVRRRTRRVTTQQPRPGAWESPPQDGHFEIHVDIPPAAGASATAMSRRQGPDRPPRRNARKRGIS